MVDPRSRIWFTPAGTGHYGCVYVGFDDGHAQGGLNIEGLAFDWVAGYMAEWPAGPGMKRAPGNPSERILETCATVEDAIAFYRLYWEPGFSKARILVAGSTGASAVIGAEGGKLRVERSKQSRGFGYCDPGLQKMLAKPPDPTVSNGAAILRAELAKGGHYYYVPQIRRQFTESPRPLLPNMKRIFLSQMQPIADREPEATNRFRTVLKAAAGGTMSLSPNCRSCWPISTASAIQSR